MTTHSDITRQLADLGAMARDLTQDHPERVISVYWCKNMPLAQIQLTADAMDALFDVEVDPDAGEDFTDLDHRVVGNPAEPCSHRVECTYTPHWGGGRVKARIVACYDAAPAWLAALLGREGTPDGNLEAVLAASVEATAVDFDGEYDPIAIRTPGGDQ